MLPTRLRSSWYARSTVVGERPVGIVVEPDLRLGNVGGDFPHDARRMFVEDMGLDARVRKAIDEEIGLDPMRRDEYPLHRHCAGRIATSASASRRSNDTSLAARAGSHGYGGVSSM